MRTVPGLVGGVRQELREVPRSQRPPEPWRCGVVAWNAVGGAVREEHDDPKARLLTGWNRPQLVPPSIEALSHVGAATRKAVRNVGHDLHLVETASGVHRIQNTRSVAKENQGDSIVCRIESVNEGSGCIHDRGPLTCYRAGHVQHQRQVHHSSSGLPEASDRYLV